MLMRPTEPNRHTVTYQVVRLVTVYLLFHHHFSCTTTITRTKGRHHYCTFVKSFTILPHSHPNYHSQKTQNNRHFPSTVSQHGLSTSKPTESVRTPNMKSQSNSIGSTAVSGIDDSMKIVLQHGRMGTLYQVPLMKQLYIVPNVKDDRNRGYPYEQRVVVTDHPNEATIGNKILCLYRFKIWWIRPIWVDSIAQIPSETIMILYQSQLKSDRPNHPTTASITYHLYLAVPVPILDDVNHRTIVSYTSASFRGTGTIAERTATAPSATNKNQKNDHFLLCSDSATTGLYVGEVTTNAIFDPTYDPYQLIQEGVQMASNVWYRQNLHWSSSFTNMDKDNIDIKVQNEQDRPSKGYTDAGGTMQNTLGWCTWNAMETNVSNAQLIQSVSMLYQKNDTIPIRWMIIDDGWQDTATDNDHNQNNSSTLTKYNGLQHHTARLKSFHEDYIKFPPKTSSLSVTIDTLKQQFSIHTVLVWHALTGYWLGLQSNVTVEANESSHLSNGNTIASQLCYPKFPYGIVQNDPSSLTEASVGLGIGIPDGIDYFYDRYYNDLLHRNGNIDGVKVDAQAITGILHPSNPKYASTNSSASILLHTALTKNVIQNFVRPNPPSYETTKDVDSNPSIIVPIIHCMAHSPEIFFRLPSLYGIHPNTASSTNTVTAPVYKPFFRVADDYYPSNIASHGAQIVACAYNTLLFGNLGIVPDWDMFTTTISDERLVRMHAISRCLSGGPIYISDNPSIEGANQRDKILKWIACTDGTTLPCRQCGVPTISSLFMDPLECNSLQQPLIIWNTNGDDTMTTSAIFGLFSLNGSGHWDPTLLDYSNNNEANDVELRESTTVSIRPIDIPIFATEDYRTKMFVALRFFDKSAAILNSPIDTVNVTLSYLQSESVSLCPIHTIMIGNDSAIQMDFVVLGIRGKINGVGAMPRIDTSTNGNGSSNNVIVMKHIQGCGEFVMAFRSDRYRTHHDDDTSYTNENIPTTTPNIDIRINDRPFPSHQMYWNRRHDDDTHDLESDPTVPSKRGDAIDALQDLGFDILSFELLSVYHRNHPNTIEVRVR